VSATIHLFPRLTGDYEPSQTSCSYLSRRLQQGPLQGHPTPPDSEVLRQTRQHIAEAWRLRAESRRIQRGYEARQKQIEVLLAGIPRAE